MRWFVLLSLAITAAAQTRSLRIFFVDVEGGQSTLVVSPSGESLLIDAGWDDERDARHIAETAQAAGIKAIDALLVTHFHRDHVGGVAGLARRLPVSRVYDHGENTENYQGSAEIMAGYRASLAKASHTVVGPGDTIPLKGLGIAIVSAGGKWIQTPLAGAGKANPTCGTEPPLKDEHTENELSIGILLTFGKFRMLDLSDLLWNQELELMCPVNRVGTADLMVVSHHGKDTSNSGTLVRAIHPRVAIMDNAENKGGSPAIFDILRSSPGLADLWQLHYSVPAASRNAAEQFIANQRGTCHGYGIQVTAERDGTFRVTNEGNQHQKTYKPAD